MIIRFYSTRFRFFKLRSFLMILIPITLLSTAYLYGIIEITSKHLSINFSPSENVQIERDNDHVKLVYITEANEFIRSREQDNNEKEKTTQTTVKVRDIYEPSIEIQNNIRYLIRDLTENEETIKTYLNASQYKQVNKLKTQIYKKINDRNNLIKQVIKENIKRINKEKKQENNDENDVEPETEGNTEDEKQKIVKGLKFDKKLYTKIFPNETFISRDTFIDFIRSEKNTIQLRVNNNNFPITVQTIIDKNLKKDETDEA
jgi:isoleucyl-tRNA synthetase